MTLRAAMAYSAVDEGIDVMFAYAAMMYAGVDEEIDDACIRGEVVRGR